MTNSSESCADAFALPGKRRVQRVSQPVAGAAASAYRHAGKHGNKHASKHRKHGDEATVLTRGLEQGGVKEGGVKETGAAQLGAGAVAAAAEYFCRVGSSLSDVVVEEEGSGGTGNEGGYWGGYSWGHGSADNVSENVSGGSGGSSGQRASQWRIFTELGRTPGLAADSPNATLLLAVPTPSAGRFLSLGFERSYRCGPGPPQSQLSCRLFASLTSPHLASPHLNAPPPLSSTLLSSPSRCI